ncbi:MAG: CerR family C-terminal domain-containing protein [Candidatus Gastranaerophilales bacterium]|nr:CerR family C-terminal domain-containing protein [Candidatus Gastranaerophilales bacterium]
MVNKKEINQKTEQKIIEVATEMFAKKGFEGTGIREICKGAEVNTCLVSYYFGGKKELYEKIVANIVEKVINYMKSSMGFNEIPTSFDHLTKQERIDFLFKAMNFILDYFYSYKISDSEIMIFFREQITSGTPLNAIGYNIFRKLLASILEKDENDKEVIFRCITIVGAIHSARVFKQFSLNMMGQEQYSHEDTLLFKDIVISQIKAILKDIGAL